MWVTTKIVYTLHIILISEGRHALECKQEIVSGSY